MRNTGIDLKPDAGDGHQANHEILDLIPADAGPRIATSRGAIFYSVRPPGSQVFIAKHHFLGVMLAPAPGLRATLGSDEVHEFNAQTGQLVINPAHVDSSLEWSCVRENAVIAMTEASLQELAEQEFLSGNTELVSPLFGSTDATALTLARLLETELTRAEGGSELYADTLITLFGIHILRNYTAGNTLTAQLRGGLGSTAARRVKEYLDENFTRQMSVKELAAVAGLSPRHFIQAFTRTFGTTPHRYLVDLRLDFAERLLRDGSLAIVEVACLSGFSSQSHLTASMRQHRGRTPGQLRSARHAYRLNGDDDNR